MADISGNQRRVLGEFLRQLQPHWHSDAGLPARIERLIRGDRRLGSRDRRLYRELIYTTLRYLTWVEPWLGTEFGTEAIAWLAADLPATRAFRSAVLGGARSPSALDELAGPESTPGSASSPGGRAPPPWPESPPTVQAKGELLAGRAGVASLPGLLPGWAEAECPAALLPAEYDALHRRAPLWVRLQGGRPDLVLEEFKSRHWPYQRSPLSSDAVRVDAEADLTGTLAYQSGMIEIQDVGSQLILAAAAPPAGGRWLDACAGAGGKSLQLADLLGPSGTVEVHDIRPEALVELERRAARAHLVSRIRRAQLTTGAAGPATNLFDGVLVDAPCTGSGTWRRSPHLKAVTTVSHIRAAAGLQSQLIRQFSSWVKPGGQLVYATCSLCAQENEGVVGRFLAENRDFAATSPSPAVTGIDSGPGRLLTPSGHDGDGFFVATLRRLP